MKKTLSQIIQSTRPTNTRPPRPYQADAVNAAIDHLFARNKTSLLLQSATGSGKTYMSNEIMFQSVNRGLKVLFLVHTDDLKRSTAKELMQRFSPYEVQVVDSEAIRYDANVVVVTAQTFTRRMKENTGAKHHNWAEIHLKRFGLVVFDEVHLNHFNHIAEASLAIPGQKRLGLTATPKRPEKSKFQLWDIFEKKIKTITYMELIQKSYNVPPFWVVASDDESATDADFFGIGTDSKGGEPEYNMNAASKIMRKKRKIYDGLIEKYKHYAQQDTKGARKMIVFCTDIEHVLETYEKFKESGINAKFMTSSPQKDTDAESKYRELEKKGGTYAHKMLIADFDKGRFDVLINAGIATTGIDIPSIQAVALIRPTLSENLYLQMCGRGNRPCQEIGKTDYILFDFAGNVKHFGLPVIERDYPWGARPKKKGAGMPPMKTCPKCNNQVWASARTCTNPVYNGMDYAGICGHIFPFSRAEAKEASAFVEGSWERILQLNGSEFGRKSGSNLATVVDVYEFWKAKKFKPTWFYHKLFELHGTAGLIEFALRTGRDPDEFLKNVAIHTSLNPFAADVDAEIERVRSRV